MKGSYILGIEVSGSIEIEVGALGEINFEEGTYVYVGSAQNGIEQRVSRHLREDKKLHWHIDYLLNHKNVEVERVYYRETEEKEEECRIAERISEFSKPVKNFGCSDCDCQSHLFRIEDSSNLKNMEYSKLEI